MIHTGTLISSSSESGKRPHSKRQLALKKNKVLLIVVMVFFVYLFSTLYFKDAL